MNAYGRPTAVELRGPDFEPMAAGYGVAYRRATTAVEVGDAIRDAVAGLSERGTLIELQAELGVPPQSL
jgi:thiamine pyrophosphate-dependent acetolactate synthase large subunit-like protein